MCGIHLIIDKTQILKAGIINTMASQTLYRGPDETNTATVKSKTQNYHFGVNRLKITDASDAAGQPFFSLDKRIALLYNGEIFNFYSLKNELIQKGIRFSTNSDTEVLFHWLRTFGISGINDLEGMFSFVFINFDTDEIIIARDRFGIKPLYYFQDEKYFIASSEIKPILSTNLVAARLNKAQIGHYLLYKYPKTPETFYQNITELSPGAILHQVSNKSNLERINPVSAGQECQNPQLSEIENLITDSLLKQINAPVPTGLLLSGGVDSTLLLALAKQEGYSLPTFSIVNSESERSFGTDDYKYAAKAAKQYGSEHHELEIDISILEKFDALIQQIDQPVGDSAFLMTSEICRYASGSMKILLSGAGADEIFGGYNRHWAFYKYLRHRKTAGYLLPAIRKFTNLLPDGYAHPLRKQVRLMRKLSNSYDVSPAHTYHKFLTFDEFPLTIASETIPELKGINDWMRWALDHDLKNYLVGDVLELSDRASMRHGIELRVPYLDDKLVDIAKSLPIDFVMSKGRKWILKELLTKHGGREFAHRPKDGFGLPLSHWLTDKRVGYLWEFVNNRNHIIFSFVDKGVIDRLLQQQRQKTHDHGPLLWSILILAHWLQRNFQ
jgi:asparagine synthase (glutamine-hydrolysing)